jgi:hypothetical protein
MASVIFNTAAINGIYSSANGLCRANSNFAPALTGVFGSGTSTADGNITTTAALLFVFKGSQPTNFSTFTSVSSRQSDLLIALPIRYPETITYSNPTGLRARVAGTVGSNLFATGIIVNVFTSNNTLVANVTSGNHSFIPGQKITFTNANNNTSANLDNVTFVIDSTPNSSFFTANSANGFINGNTVVATGNSIVRGSVDSVALANGVATWFVAARWGTGTNITTTTSFNDFGAVIGNISIPNAGGDLQIPNTTIVEGTFYTSSGMFVNFPFEWPV